MTDIITRNISIHDEGYHKVYELREEILRKPIGLSLKNEDLSGDALDVIVIAENNDDIIGCVMIHPTDNTEVLKLRQMAVADKWQGKGVGNLLMKAAEQQCRDKGARKIILHARVTAQTFYEKLGYAVVSGVFTEVGIPHVVMEKPVL